MIYVPPGSGNLLCSMFILYDPKLSIALSVVYLLYDAYINSFNRFISLPFYDCFGVMTPMALLLTITIRSVKEEHTRPIVEPKPKFVICLDLANDRIPPNTPSKQFRTHSHIIYETIFGYSQYLILH